MNLKSRLFSWASGRPLVQSALLWVGARAAGARRWLARRNFTTLTGIFFGSLSIAATGIIVAVPVFLKSDDFLKSHALPTELRFGHLSFAINLGWIVLGAYAYQLLFRTVRTSRVDEGIKRHDLNRKLIERTLIREIQERISRDERLLDDIAILKGVLEAILSKVSEKIGGYSEKEKLEANLLIRPKDPPERIRVIARYGSTREFPKDYPLEQRSFCAKVWQGDTTAAARRQYPGHFARNQPGYPIQRHPSPPSA